MHHLDLITGVQAFAQVLPTRDDLPVDLDREPATTEFKQVNQPGNIKVVGNFAGFAVEQDFQAVRRSRCNMHYRPAILTESYPQRLKWNVGGYLIELVGKVCLQYNYVYQGSNLQAGWRR